MAVAFARAGRYYGCMPNYPPDKLNARDAISILGISRWKFFKLVEAGTIKRYVEEPYVLGYYRRGEIEAYKRRLEDARRHLDIVKDDPNGAK